MTLEIRLEIAAQVAEALAWSHQLGVLHQDLKPANILLDACGPDRFRFYTDRSIAAWMTTWLEDATVEYRAG